MSNSNEKAIIDILQEFRLSSNGSKAYLTLLKNSPSTGYEISTQSGIPRSAIYSVLSRLESMGIVNSIGDNPKRYIPLSASSLIEHLSHLHTDRIMGLTSALDSLETDDEAFDFWHVHGYRNLIIKMREVIINAKNKVFLSAWAKEIVSVENELEDAEKRGVEVTLFSFCELSRKFGETVTYNLKQSDLEAVWHPKTILVADQKITVMGSAIDTDDSRSIWTQNQAITEIAMNHIILDITLAGQRLGFDPNPVVQRILRRPDLELDRLLSNSGK
jgi:HTH-type transcriptional regulator, sugar sensing transcriptional regulator